MEFIDTHNLGGIAIGAIAFLIIGLFHPIVIKTEYYWGTKLWWVFLLLGLLLLAVAMVCHNSLMSATAGVTAFTCFWSIHELFEQKQRVARGWFPSNPKRTAGNQSYKSQMSNKA